MTLKNIVPTKDKFIESQRKLLNATRFCSRCGFRLDKDENYPRNVWSDDHTDPNAVTWCNRQVLRYMEIC
jgi:predicted amidophosphoribosyltransferase